jgi:hypothetical protein
LIIESDGWFPVTAGGDRPDGDPMQRQSRHRNGLCAVYARILAAANTARRKTAIAHGRDRLGADASDREQSVHSIMNTDSGDHEHVFAPA